jgi:hypothetical protein
MVSPHEEMKSQKWLLLLLLLLLLGKNKLPTYHISSNF